MAPTANDEEGKLAHRRGHYGAGNIVRGTQEQQLSFFSAARKFVSNKSKEEVLREALEHLDRDRSFEPTAADEIFEKLDAMIGGDVDLVIAGHTHLERSLQRKTGRGHYFNSGTWARLIHIDPAVRQDSVEFANLFRLLAGGTMSALDAGKTNAGGVQRGIVLKRNTVVVVKAPNVSTPSATTQASLHHVLPAANGKPVRLDVPAASLTWTGG